MPHVKYGQKIAKNVPQKVNKELRKRFVIENKKFQEEQREAQQAMDAAQAVIRIREKFWMTLADRLKMDQFLRDLKSLQQGKKMQSSTK